MVLELNVVALCTFSFSSGERKGLVRTAGTRSTCGTTTRLPPTRGWRRRLELSRTGRFVRNRCGSLKRCPGGWNADTEAGRFQPNTSYKSTILESRGGGGGSLCNFTRSLLRGMTLVRGHLYSLVTYLHSMIPDNSMCM